MSQGNGLCVWKTHADGSMELIDEADQSDPAPGVYYVVGNGKRYEVRVLTTPATRSWWMWVVLFAMAVALLAAAVCVGAIRLSTWPAIETGEVLLRRMITEVSERLLAPKK